VFRGPAVPANQVHDFHSPISPEGLYWVTPVPSDGITFTPDDKTVALQMKDVPIIDQPRWPAMDAESTPAYLDFKLVFKSTEEPVKYDDPARQYRSTDSGPLRNLRLRCACRRSISHSKRIRWKNLALISPLWERKSTASITKIKRGTAAISTITRSDKISTHDCLADDQSSQSVHGWRPGSYSVEELNFMRCPEW
jgi:hypothetical protein